MKEFIEKKNGTVTPSDIAKTLQKWIEEDNIRNLVIILQDESEGEVHVGWANLDPSSLFFLLGLLDAAKEDVMERHIKEVL